MTNPTSFFPATSLTAHDNKFESMIGMFPDRIKGKIWHQYVQNVSLPVLTNRSGFYGLEEKKMGCKNWKKPASPQFFYHFSFPLSPQFQPPIPPSAPPHFSFFLHSGNSSSSSRPTIATIQFLSSLAQAAAAPTPPLTQPLAARQTGDASCTTPAPSKHFLLPPAIFYILTFVNKITLINTMGYWKETRNKHPNKHRFSIKTARM